MTTKTDFSAEEWDALLAGPLAASMYIIVSSPSVFGSIKEITAMTKELAKAATRPDNTELLRFMLADYQDKDAMKRITPNIKGNAEEVKNGLRAIIARAVELLNAKATPEESAQIRAWMSELAVTTAEAAREGGFLGIGAVRVSDAEKRALVELSEVLGVEVPEIAAEAAEAPADEQTEEPAAEATGETVEASAEDAADDDTTAA